MKLYFAPMEGINGYIYRNAYRQFFPFIDKYFTPFISPNKNRTLSPREKRDILPENNTNIQLVPQILTNNAEYFVRTAMELKEKYGYEEVNLNLGCPSGTVVSKGKGAGFLAKTEELDSFLQEIFTKSNIKLSIKTRIGKERPEEFEKLLEIFNQYPVHELIIHPRVQTDFYKNRPNREAFARAVEKSKNPLCYNGDIFTEKDLTGLCADFAELESVMLGRGLLVNPALAKGAGRGGGAGCIPEKQVLKEFHDKLYGDYKEALSGEKPVLFKMKELWFYMIHIFSCYEKYLKLIKKAAGFPAYEEAVRRLFEEQEIVGAHL